MKAQLTELQVIERRTSFRFHIVALIAVESVSKYVHIYTLVAFQPSAYLVTRAMKTISRETNNIANNTGLIVLMLATWTFQTISWLPEKKEKKRRNCFRTSILTYSILPFHPPSNFIR